MTEQDADTVAADAAGGENAGAVPARKKRTTSEKRKKASAVPVPFEQRRARLEEIVSRLESGELPLEESLALYEEGVSLVRACMQELDDAEQKVKILRRTAEGEIRPADFAGTEES